MVENREIRGLPRHKHFQTQHAEPCASGRIMALYIFRSRNWLKIGEYCPHCGAFIIFPEFEKGLPHDIKH